MPGPRSRELLAEQDELESSARSYPRSVPVAIEEGRGATMKDVDGNTFIDFFGGAGVLNVGHGHPAVLAAAAEQERKLVHALDFPTKPKLRLMSKLKTLLPGRLRESAKFHFGGPTGSDAIESALEADTRPHRARGGDRLPGLLPRDDHWRPVCNQRCRLWRPNLQSRALHALPLLLSLPARPAARLVRAGVREPARHFA